MKDKEAFDKINEKTNQLAATAKETKERVAALIAKITEEKGELSPELAAEAEAIAGTLDESSATLTGIAADPANPVPEV